MNYMTTVIDDRLRQWWYDQSDHLGNSSSNRLAPPNTVRASASRPTWGKNLVIVVLQRVGVYATVTFILVGMGQLSDQLLTDQKVRGRGISSSPATRGKGGKVFILKRGIPSAVIMRITLSAWQVPGSEVLPEGTAQCCPLQGPRGRTKHWEHYHHNSFFWLWFISSV